VRIFAYNLHVSNRTVPDDAGRHPPVSLGTVRQGTQRAVCERGLIVMSRGLLNHNLTSDQAALLHSTKPWFVNRDVGALACA